MFTELDKVYFTTAHRHEVAKAISVVRISIPSPDVTFDKKHTLHDIRMGAFRNVPCGTCGKGYIDCPGHFGHIELSKPCLNPSFVKTVLKRIVNLYCFKCFDKTCKEPEGKTRPSKRQKRATCGKVKIIHVKHYSNQLCGTRVSFEMDGERLSLEQFYNLLRMIPKRVFVDDFPHYKEFPDLTDSVFIHNLLVLPIASRAPNMVKGDWSADSITLKYNDILEKNTTLHHRKRTAIHAELIEEMHNDLQASIDVLFDVNNTNAKLRSNAFQSGGLRQRIDGKQGRLRLNLMGKRCEFTARTVLSGDPNLGFNEVGIPTSVAETLTIPVLVNKYNVHKMRDYNIKYIFKADGRKFDTSVMRAYKIEIGDTVERSLVDYDICAINRQPTLHRGSILAMYIRIFPCSTFRLNYSTMVTLNADTDGDEINLHVPQDLESRAELENLMLASTNIVCSQGARPLVGCTQDSLLGCYLLSKDTDISWADYSEILYKMDIDCERNGARWTGLDVITAALNHVGVFIEHYETDSFQLEDNVPRAGSIVNKSVLGATNNSLIHHVFLQAGHHAAGKFIHVMQRAATAYLDIVGFSVGISDCVINDVEPIKFDALEKTLDKDFFTGQTDEVELTAALSELIKLKAEGSNLSGNRLLDMINSGSKGTMLNFNQITRVVGQQIEEEGRISERFRGNRTLPHFPKYKQTAESKGLVKNSFIKGLKPHEFFFHAMGGRVGLIDTSVKTSTTGAQNRRLNKSLETLIVKDVGNSQRMVFNSNGEVVQWNYGEDGYDGTYLKD